MSPSVAESTVEEAALSWFEELGYTIVHGPDIAPGELFAEREGYSDVVLVRRFANRSSESIPTFRRRPSTRRSGACCIPRLPA